MRRVAWLIVANWPQIFNCANCLRVAQDTFGALLGDPLQELPLGCRAGMVGSRRSEIDLLEWSLFRWDLSVIRIEPTRYFHPKSEDSIGDVQVDSELMDLFRGYRARATGEFVIESVRATGRTVLEIVLVPLKCPKNPASPSSVCGPAGWRTWFR